MALGAWKGDLAGIRELIDQFSGKVTGTCMATASIHIRPADITTPAAVANIENTVLRPLAALRDSGYVKITDFTSLVSDWRRDFGARGCTWQIK